MAGGGLLTAALVALAAGLGAGLAPWARAYARALDAGAPPDARTLWRAAWAWPRTAFVPWRDIPMAAALAVGTFWLLGHADPAGGARVIGVVGVAASGLLWALAALAWIDWCSGLLPDALTLPLLLAGCLFGPLGPVAAGCAAALVWALAALLARGYQAWRGRCGFGGGDVKCLAALAAWMGVSGALAVLWLACVLAVMAACAASLRPVFGRFGHRGRGRRGRADAHRSGRRRASAGFSAGVRFGPHLATAAAFELFSRGAIQSWFVIATT